MVALSPLSISTHLSPFSFSSSLPLSLLTEIKHFLQASPQSPCSNVVKLWLNHFHWLDSAQWKHHKPSSTHTHVLLLCNTHAVDPVYPCPSLTVEGGAVNGDIYLDDIPISTLGDMQLNATLSKTSHETCLCAFASLRFGFDPVFLCKDKKEQILWLNLAVNP